MGITYNGGLVYCQCYTFPLQRRQVSLHPLGTEAQGFIRGLCKQPGKEEEK